MDPKLCTVVILHQIKPKIIEDESSINSYQKLLSSYYGQGSDTMWVIFITLINLI